MLITQLKQYRSVVNDNKVQDSLKRQIYPFESDDMIQGMQHASSSTHWASGRQQSKSYIYILAWQAHPYGAPEFWPSTFSRDLELLLHRLRPSLLLLLPASAEPTVVRCLPGMSRQANIR